MSSYLRGALVSLIMTITSTLPPTHDTPTQVTRMVRHADDKLLILASDGLWDVLSSADVCAMALRKFEGELGCGGSVRGALRKAASALAKAALDKGSRDNVTVLVVDLRPAAPVA